MATFLGGLIMAATLEGERFMRDRRPALALRAVEEPELVLAAGDGVRAEREERAEPGRCLARPLCGVPPEGLRCRVLRRDEEDVDDVTDRCDDERDMDGGRLARRPAADGPVKSAAPAPTLGLIGEVSESVGSMCASNSSQPAESARECLFPD